MNRKWDLIVLVASIVTFGCGNRQLYDIVQTSQRMKCQNLPPREYDACIEKTSATYDQYEKDRGEVIHK